MYYMLSIFIKNLEANYISFSKLNEQKKYDPVPDLRHIIVWLSSERLSPPTSPLPCCGSPHTDVLPQVVLLIVMTSTAIFVLL